MRKPRPRHLTSPYFGNSPLPTRTRDAHDGEPFEVLKRDRLVCCDCGLTHDVEWVVKRGKLYMVWTRARESTRRRRKAIAKLAAMPISQLFHKFIIPGLEKQLHSDTVLWKRFAKTFRIKGRFATLRMKTIHDKIAEKQAELEKLTQERDSK